MTTNHNPIQCFVRVPTPLGLIHTVENTSLIAATSDLSVAGTRDSVTGHQNVPEGFGR